MTLPLILPTNCLSLIMHVFIEPSNSVARQRGGASAANIDGVAVGGVIGIGQHAVGHTAIAAAVKPYAFYVLKCHAVCVESSRNIYGAVVAREVCAAVNLQRSVVNGVRHN